MRVTPTEEPDGGRSSRQDCSPAGESPAVPRARNRHVAMPHPDVGNHPGDAWCIRPGRPSLTYMSRRGGCNLGAKRVWEPEHERMTAATKHRLPVEVALQGVFRVPSTFPLVRGRSRAGRNGYEHRTDTAGYGSKRLRKEYRDNVGKGRLSAGTDRNLQRRPAEGNRGRARRAVWRMSPYER